MRNLRPTALAELFMKLGGGCVIEQHFDKILREVEPTEPQTQRHPLRGRSVDGQVEMAGSSHFCSRQPLLVRGLSVFGVLATSAST